MKKILRLAEKSFIILGLTFFSGAFGIYALGYVLPKAFVTLIRFFIWGSSSILICTLWRSTITTISRGKLLCILTGLALLSFLWSESLNFTLFETREVWMMTSFALYFAVRFNLKEQVQIVTYTLFIGIFLSIVFALQFPAIGIDAGHQGAWQGVYGHKNILGSMMVINSFSFFLLPKENSILYRWVGVASSLVLILFSTSKTSLVIYFLTILIILFYKNFQWQGKISIIFINIGIIISACVALLVITYWVEILTGLGRNPTLTGRTPLWGYAIGRLMEKPLLGYGRGAFWAPESHYAIEAGRAIGTSWIPPHAHNGLLDLALDVGLIGMSLFLISYFTTFAQALKLAYATKNPEQIWPLAYLSFLAMNNVTESYLMRSSNLYWVLFLTVVFTINKKDKFKINNEKLLKRQSIKS